jgi:predicted ATPase
MLHDPHCRLLTLTGLGGIGKSLALGTAWQIASQVAISDCSRHSLCVAGLDRFRGIRGAS